MNRYLALRTLLVPVMFLLLVDESRAEIRKWTDATGKFTIEAEIVELRDMKVVLKKADGQMVTVELNQLSAADQEVAKQLAGNERETATASKLTGKPQELKNDDGMPVGKKSFPKGIASQFKAPAANCFVTSVRIHGSRYGLPQAPKEDFHVSICDKDFKLLADFKFPYSKFKRGDNEWVSLSMKPTQVPEDFIICLNFNAERTKGVYVSHDGEGKSLVGLPEKPAGAFTGGDWLIRPSVDTQE